jgi:hypothetical protein
MNALARRHLIAGWSSAGESSETSASSAYQWLTTPTGTRYLVADEAPVDREAARARAGELRADGLSYSRIAAEVGVHPSTVKGWARRGLVS